MAKVLREQGIKEENIIVIPDEVEAIEKGLSIAEHDDLVIVFGDAITRCWKQIIHFNGINCDPENPTEKPVKAETSSLETNEPDPFVLASGMKIVKDERGVRLVSEHDEESD